MPKVSISKAAEFLGVSTRTLYRWEKQGKLFPEYTPSGQRRYELSSLTVSKSVGNNSSVSAGATQKTNPSQVAGSEASCFQHAQNEQLLEYFQEKNVQSQELVDLLKLLCSEEIQRLTLTSDQLEKIDTELLFSLCNLLGVEVVILPSQDPRLEEDLAKKILEAIADFSAVFDGYDNRQKRKFIDQVQKIIKSLDNYYQEKLSGEFADC